MDVRIENGQTAASTPEDADVISAVKSLTLGKHSAEVLLSLVKDGLIKNYSGANLKKFVLENFSKASFLTFKTHGDVSELCTCVDGFVDVLIDLLDKKQKVVEIVGEATSWLKMCRF